MAYELKPGERVRLAAPPGATLVGVGLEMDTPAVYVDDPGGGGEATATWWFTTTKSTSAEHEVPEGAGRYLGRVQGSDLFGLGNLGSYHVFVAESE